MELAYSLNTLYFLLSGVLVMWMAAGFTMLEAGSVRSKNVIEILLKNIALYSIASIGFLVVGYELMYGWGQIDTHAMYSDFFFQVVFVATAMSVVSGAVAERKKLCIPTVVKLSPLANSIEGNTAHRMPSLALFTTPAQVMDRKFESPKVVL